MKKGGEGDQLIISWSIVLFRFNIYNGARPSETVPAGTQVILNWKFYALVQYVVGSMCDNCAIIGGETKSGGQVYIQGYTI